MNRLSGRRNNAKTPGKGTRPEIAERSVASAVRTVAITNLLSIFADSIAIIDQREKTIMPEERIAAGILTKADIENEVRTNGLISNFVATSLSPCSYDLRIGTIFLDEKIIKETTAGMKQVILQPGEIISVFTLEELSLAANIAGTAFAINQMSSDGLLVLNPGHIDPGFKGPLSVRLINIRATPKAILLGMPIFTVIFEYLPKATTPYDENQPRAERELAFETRDVEQNPRSLYNLVASGKNRPIMNYQEVRSIIAEHWMSRSVFIITIAAAAFAGLTLYIVWRDFEHRSQTSTASPSTPAVTLQAEHQSPPNMRINETPQPVESPR
jgi:deoxycytidine triphosphate deaminase